MFESLHTICLHTDYYRPTYPTERGALLTLLPAQASSFWRKFLPHVHPCVEFHRRVETLRGLGGLYYFSVSDLKMKGMFYHRSTINVGYIYEPGGEATLLVNPNESTPPKSISISRPRDLRQTLPTIRPLIYNNTSIPDQPTNNKVLILLPKERHTSQLIQTGVDLIHQR